jgi:hypothetical protein
MVYRFTLKFCRDCGFALVVQQDSEVHEADPRLPVLTAHDGSPAIRDLECPDAPVRAFLLSIDAGQQVGVTADDVVTAVGADADEPVRVRLEERVGPISARDDGR